MKKNLLLTLLFVLTSFASLQANDSGRLAYFPVVSGVNIPAEAKTSLLSKIQHAISSNGYGSLNYTDRFVLLAKCSAVDKNIAPTTPPRIRQTIEVTFIVGDAVENKIYASETFTLNGIGTNETKAWLTAINEFNPRSNKFGDLLNAANSKIGSYYSERCADIISEARNLSSIGDFDGAITLLLDVPNICTTCFDECNKLALEIYQHKIDEEGKTLLAKAKAEWSMTGDEKASRNAFDILNKINPESSSYGVAMEFGETLSSKLDESRESERKQRLKQYNDELELRRKGKDYFHQRAMASIAAYRSVAEKRAENQPQTTVYLNW